MRITDTKKEALGFITCGVSVCLMAVWALASASHYTIAPKDYQVKKAAMQQCLGWYVKPDGTTPSIPTSKYRACEAKILGK